MSHKTYKPSQQTKEKIIQKALDVFNANGTANVSLNSLAEEIGVSAGNLQYHYRNKKEIIRAILESMYKDWNLVYQEMVVPSFTMDTLRYILEINFKLVWKYRFFYRELNALLRNDKSLAKRYASIQEERLAEQEMIMKRMAGPGGVQPMSKSELRNIIVIGWVLSNSWLSYVESTGQTVDESVMNEAVEVLIQHYMPYLQENI